MIAQATCGATSVVGERALLPSIGSSFAPLRMCGPRVRLGARRGANLMPVVCASRRRHTPAPVSERAGWRRAGPITVPDLRAQDHSSAMRLGRNGGRGLEVGLSNSRWSAFLKLALHPQAQLSQAAARRNPVKGNRGVIVIVTVDRAKWSQAVEVFKLCGYRAARCGSERHQRPNVVRLSEADTDPEVGKARYRPDS